MANTPEDYVRDVASRRARAGKPIPLKITPGAMSRLRERPAARRAASPFIAPQMPPPIAKAMGGDRLAMDYASTNGLGGWATNLGGFDGYGFFGYARLAEMAQRPEYRIVSTTWASHATRKWIKLRGPDQGLVDAVNAEMYRLKLRETLREACEHDGLFGRGQLFIDLGNADNGAELATPMPLTRAKVGKGKLVGFKPVEPIWSWPAGYNTQNPLHQQFYKPGAWQVYSNKVHASRLLTMVGREVPDLLKPAYAFGGVSFSQMLEPCVESFARDREATSALLRKFSRWVLLTDMSQDQMGGITGAGMDALAQRAEVFVELGDNNGIAILNKATEELSNVSTSIAGMAEIVEQAMDIISMMSGIPGIELFGEQPNGMNADSEGEIRVFETRIHEYQERVLRGPIETALAVIQLSLGRDPSPDLTFDFVPLREETEAERAATNKLKADVDNILVATGAIGPEDVRKRLSEDEGSPYHGIDLVVPEVEEDEDEPDSSSRED